ncbi:hypothetical protein BGHDH14_bghG002320000001001 [Blumeria hordei DH14]|uniref:Involucrin repeat protein n=1 Tax=Blumeria graminis f. sp. hordei (strain DH14) TaxID=546991 RepID=N1JEG3_BLUG1|nr:hypothetical protein BGHDH14_bghG002320000001001 [Blumeria hordei DH14]
MAGRQRRGSYNSSRRLPQDESRQSEPRFQSVEGINGNTAPALPRYLSPVAMSMSENTETQVAPVQSYPSSPTHNSQRSQSQSPISIEKSSTSSSSSYLEISRSFPARKSRIRSFFTAPSEQKQKLKKGKTRKHFFRFGGSSGSSSSSSSVDSDLAYGTGFIKLPRSRKKRHKAQERGKDQKLHPTKNADKFSKRQQDTTSPTASILAIGSGLARLAAHQSKTTIPASDRRGRGFQSMRVPKSPESPPTFDKFSESSWESTSSSDSSSSVDSRLAYENEPSPSWSFFGKKKIDKNFRDPPPERIFYPKSQSGIPNYVDKAVGSDEIPPWTVNKKNYQNYNYLSANAGTNELNQKRDLNTQNKFDSHQTSNLKAAEVKLHSNSVHNLSNQSGTNATFRQEDPLLPQPFNPPPLQIIQPQPITPVSSSLYGPIYNAQMETLPSVPDEESWPQSFTNAMNSNAQLRRLETSNRDLDHKKIHQLPQEEHGKSFESGAEIQRCELRLAEIERERIELQNKERHESQRRDRAKLAIQMEIERRKSKGIRDYGRDQETQRSSNRYGPEPESSCQIDMKSRIFSNDEILPQSKSNLHNNPENRIQLDKYSEFQIKPINHIPPATVITSPLQFQVMHDNEAPITTQNLVQRKGLEFLPTNDLLIQKDLRYQHPVQRLPHNYDSFHNYSKNQTGRPFFESNENQQEKKCSNDDLATVTDIREQDTTAKAHLKDTNSGKSVDQRPGVDYNNIESQLSSMPRHNLDIPGSNRTSPDTSSIRRIVTNIRSNSTPPSLCSGVNIGKKPEKYVTTASVFISEKSDRQVYGKYYVSPGNNSTSDDVPERQEKLQNINNPKNRFVYSHDELPQNQDTESIETSTILNPVQSILSPSTEMGKDGIFYRQSPTYIHSEKKRQPIIDSIHSSKNKSVPKSRQPSTPKGVTWGRNETKHYEVESLSENQDEYFDNPDKEALEYSDSEFDYNANKVRESPFNNANKSMGGRNTTVGASSTHGVSTKNKYNYFISKNKRPNKIRDLEETEFENSPQKATLKVFPSRSPENLESFTNIPGAFQDDFDFTATLAAGLQDTGFDPNIVIDSLTFHQKNKKHSSENLDVFYHAPYAETVSDLDLYSARTPESQNVSNEYYLNESRTWDQGCQDVLSLSRSASPKDSKNKQKFNKGRKSRGKDKKIDRLKHIALPETSTESHENCNEAYMSNAEDLDEDSRKKDISLSSSVESMSSLNSRKDIDVNMFKNALLQKKEGIHYKTRQNSDLSSYLVPDVDFSYIIPSSESKNFGPRGGGIVNASSLDATSTNNNPDTIESNIYRRGSRKSDKPSYRRSNKALSSAIIVINKDPRKIPSKRHQTTSFSDSKFRGRYQNHMESEESSTEVERVSVPIDSFEFLNNNYGAQPELSHSVTLSIKSNKTSEYLDALDTADSYSNKITRTGDFTRDTDKISTPVEVFVDSQDEYQKPKLRRKKEIYQAFNEERLLPEICHEDSSEGLVLGPNLPKNTTNREYKVVQFPFREKSYLQESPSSKDSYKTPKGSAKNCYKNTLEILHSSQFPLASINSHSQGHVSQVKIFKSREDSDNESNLELLENRNLKADETQNHNARSKEVGHRQLPEHDQFISFQSFKPSEFDENPSSIKREVKKNSKAEKTLSQIKKKYEHDTKKINKQLNYCSTSTESLIPCTSSSAPFQYDSNTDTCSPKPESKRKYTGGKVLQQNHQPKLEKAPLVLYKNSLLCNENNLGKEIFSAGNIFKSQINPHTDYKKDPFEENLFIARESFPEQEVLTNLGHSSRQFSLSIDPQFGDLLSLPPSDMILLEKNSVQSLENLPKLPDSETDSIQTDRLLEDRSFNKVRKGSLRESPLKSPSQSSVPLSLQFKKRTSSLSELPFISDTSPTFLCTPTPQYLLQSKRYRSRPKSWDRTTDYQPLYLLESCSRNSPLSDNFNDLPALPDSPKVKRDKNLNKSEDYKDASGNDYPRILMKPDLPVHRSSSPNSLETTVVNRSSELDFNQIQLSEYSVLHEEEKKEVEYRTNKEPISPKIEFIDKNSTDYYPNNIQNEEQTPPPQINTKSKENNASELQNIKNCSDVFDLDSLSINSNYSHHEKNQSITTNINSSNPDMQVASTVGPLEYFSAPRGKKQRRKINQKRYDRNLQKGNNVNKQGVYNTSQDIQVKEANSLQQSTREKDLATDLTLEENEEEQTNLYPSELVFEKTADSVEDAPEMKDMTVVPTLEENKEEQTDLHPSELVFEKTADSVEDAPEMKDLTVVPTLEENKEEQTDLHPSELVFEKTADSVEDAPEMKDLTVVPTLEENKEEQTDLHPSELVFEKTADSVEDAPEMKDLTVVPTLEENKEEQTDLHPSELVFEKTADSVEDAPEMKDLTVVPTLEEKEEEETDFISTEIVFESTTNDVEKGILSNMSLPVDLIGERNNIRQPASEENILTAATVCKGQNDSHVSSSILEMRLEEVKCSMHSHAEQKYVVGDQLKMEEHKKSSAKYPVNFSKFDVVENKKPSHSLNLYHKDDQNKDTTFFDLDGEIANKSIPLDYVQEDVTEGFCNGDKQKVMKFVSVSNDQVEIPTNNCPLDTSDNNIIKKDFEVKPLTELEFKSYSTSPHKDQVLGFVIKKGDGLTNLRDQSGGASNTVQESKRSSVSCTEKQLNEIKDNDDVKISDSSTKHLSLKNSSDRSKDEINANDKRYSSPSNQDYYGDELPLKFDTRAVNQDQVQRKVTDEQLSNSNIYDQTITDKIKTNIVELSLESNKIHNNVENLQVDSKGIAPGEKLYETVKPQETILYQDTNSQLSTSLKYDQSGLNSDSETPKVKPRNTIKGNKVARPEKSRRKNLSSKNHHTNDPEGTKTPAMPEIKRFEESSSTIFSTKSSTPLASNNEENMALPSMLSFEEDVGTKCSDMTTSSKANFPVNSATIESSVNKEDKDESLVTSNKLATYQDKFPQTNLSSTENSEKISQSIRNIAPNQNLLKKDNIIAQVNDTISTSMDSSGSLVKTKETVTKIEASEASKRDSEEKNGNRPISKKKARKGKRNQKNGISTPIDEIKYSSPLADPSQSSECNPTAGSQDLVECNVEFYNPAQDLTWGQFRQVRKNPTKDVENQKGFSIKGDNEILYQVAKSLEAIPGQYTGIKHQGSVIGRWGSQELDKIMSTIKNQNKEQFYTSIPNTTDNTVEYEANFLNIEEPKALKPVGLNCVKNQIDTEISQIETVFSFGSIKSASGLNDRNQSFRLLQPSYTTLLVPKKVSKEFLIIKFEIDDKGKEEFRINQYDGTPTISPDKFLIVDKVIANVTESLDINYKIPGLNYQSIDRYLQSEKFEIPCHKFYTEASRHYNGRLYLFNNLSKSSTTGNYIKFQFTTDFKFDLNFNTIESISNFSMGKYLYKIFRAIFETNLDDKTSQKPSSLDDSMQNSKISLFLSDRQSAESFWSFEVRLFSGNSSSNMMQISGLQTNKVLSGSSLNLKSRLVVVLLANQEILQKYEEKIQDFNKKLPSNATNLEDTSFLNRITKKTPEKNRYGANSIEILSFCQENKIRIMEDLYISGQLELPSFSKAIPISLIKSLTIYWSNSSDFQSQSLSINSESKFLKLTNNASITPPNSSIINNGMFLLKTKLPEITEENKCHKITQIPVRITEISKIGALEKLAVTETPINYSEKYKFKSYIQKSCNENELYIVSCQSFESLLESHQGYQSNGEDQSHKSLSLQPSLRMPTSLEKGKLSSDDMEETQKSITTSTSKSLTESQSSSHEIAPHTIHYPSFGKIESFSDPGYSLSHRAEDKYANIRHTPSLLSSKIVSTLNKDLPDSRIQRSDDKIEAPKFIESDSSEYPQERKSKRKTYVELKTFQPKAQNLVAGTRNLVAGTVLERAALQGCAITRKLNVDQLSSSTQTQRSISEVSRSSNCEPASFASTRHNSTCTSFRGSEVQTSRDLRSLSQPTSKLNLTRQPAPPHIANPQANEGRVRVKDMADVFDGVGEGRLSSPRSPTRPPSMRRRQSMKVLDLECKIEQLVEQNHALVEKVELAEKTAKQYTQKAVHEKVVEIESLTQALDWFKKEVSRLKELNEGLKSAGSKIARQQNERIESLETDNVNSGQEIQLKRDPHRRVSTKDEMALQTAISDKNKEIANLCAELDKAKQKIRDLQKQILVSKTNNTEFFVVRDEDYFDKACQQLCQHVQQWVLRFSKFSDMKACRLTDKINNDKTVNRLQSAILDGSDVDLYLSDRIKRRDIFMSIVMTMIWEFIFTRYLFGMDREQRQKLKTLEKILSEVGPASAVHLWRVTTLTLLSRRSAFAQQRVLDTQAVVHTIIETLSEILPPPSSLEEKVREQLTRVINEAANLSVEMRCQKAEYMMLPPLQPEREPSGNVTRKVYFNARLMNERSGETLSNKELEDKKSIVRVVLFPLVVKKGDSRGEGEEETVVCPAQVLVARPKKTVHYSDEVHSRVSTKSSFPMTELGSVV